MKKLTKMQINPIRLMNKNDLLRVRGGYDCWNCKVYVSGDTYYWQTWCGVDLMTTQGECASSTGNACYCF